MHIYFVLFKLFFCSLPRLLVNKDFHFGGVCNNNGQLVMYVVYVKTCQSTGWDIREHVLLAGSWWDFVRRETAAWRCASCTTPVMRLTSTALTAVAGFTRHGSTSVEHPFQPTTSTTPRSRRPVVSLINHTAIFRTRIICIMHRLPAASWQNITSPVKR